MHSQNSRNGGINMIKYKLKKDAWKEVLRWLNPKIIESVAVTHAKNQNISEAALLLLITEIGVKIVKALMKGKPEISISFSYTEALEMINFINAMTADQQSENLFVRNIAVLMSIQVNKEITNYKPIYQ